MDELRALRCDGVQFIGGEPTVHPRFLDLVEYAHRCEFRTIEIYTNATRLSSATCLTLKRLGAQIAVSFYAADPSIHDAITQRIGSYERTVAGIEEAVRHGLRVRVGIIEMDLNRHCMDSAKAFVESLGVEEARIDRERRIGRAADHLSPGSLLEELCGACGAGRIAINADGEVSPCVFSHFRPIGTVSSGVSASLMSEQLATFRRELSAVGATACSPSCGPHECSPGEGGGPCFPKGCDPDICNPRACAPRD